MESIAAICALRQGVAPPVVSLDDLDAEIAVTGIDIATKPRELRTAAGPSVALNNSFGFGGHNVALAFATA